MRILPDTELRAALLREAMEVHEKKRAVEESLRTADMRNRLLIERAARKDIEAYMNRHVVSPIAKLIADNVGKREV
jgi:hypothetical protein